jgi:hypothetical protein
MATTNPSDVSKKLAKVAKSKREDPYETEELYYDPESNVLSVSRKGEYESDPDRIPATSMAREGFF